MKDLRITVISDTHAKHWEMTEDLPGGDILLYAGDFMTSGYHITEVSDFCKWLTGLNYTHNVFIAGNHDRLFENSSNLAMEIVNSYKWINYLQDDWLQIGENFTYDIIKIYGSPWQPEFFNWAFNLPRQGQELKDRWDKIPNDTDILLTHGPGYGYLDVSSFGNKHVGCELLIKRIKQIKPKIHVFGHIHSDYGYKFDGDTHYFNASALNERYDYANKPMTFDWNPVTNDLNFV